MSKLPLALRSTSALFAKTAPWYALKSNHCLQLLKTESSNLARSLLGFTVSDETSSTLACAMLTPKQNETAVASAHLQIFLKRNLLFFLLIFDDSLIKKYNRMI